MSFVGFFALGLDASLMMNNAKLVATCKDADAGVRGMIPTAFSEVMDPITLALNNVPATCVNLPITTPCVADSSGLYPKLFSCKYTCEKGSVTTDLQSATATQLRVSGVDVGLEVTLVCPASEEVVEVMGPLPATCEVEALYNGKALPWVGLPDGNKFTFARSSPPPPNLPSPSPPPSPAPLPPSPPARSVFSVYSRSSSNFHPQGMCYDATADELVLVYQSENQMTRVSPSNGATLGKISHNQGHATSCASYAGGWIVASYGGNTGGQDMFKIDRNSKSVSNYGSYGQAYGGYPLTTMGDSQLVRGERSTSYSWSSITQIRLSPLTSPDSVSATYETGVSGGIGDLCYDGSNLYAVNYDTVLSGRRLAEGRRLGSGATIHKLNSNNYRSEKQMSETCPSNLTPVGIACKPGIMWILCWGGSSASVIRIAM